MKKKKKLPFKKIYFQMIFFLINLERVKLIKEFNLDYFYLYTFLLSAYFTKV